MRMELGFQFHHFTESIVSKCTICYIFINQFMNRDALRFHQYTITNSAQV